MPVKQMTGKSDLKGIFDGVSRHGEVVSGVVGGASAPLYVKDDDKLAEISPEEKIEARVLRNLLLKWIDPPRLSEKSKPDQDKQMFSRKVNAQSLADLKRFFEVELPEELMFALRRKYQDISP